MTIREPKEILPTMKITPDGELDLKFEKCEAVIKKISDIETKKFGEKTIITLENEKLKRFNIFANNYTIENLCKKFGNDDEKWINQKVKLELQKEKQYNNEMIVLVP